MRAEESTKNFRSKLKENTNFCVREIKHICANFDKRGSGSKGERDAQEYMAKRLGEWADEVKIEEFTLHPAAFMAWVIICGLALIACIFIYNFLSPLVSFIVLALCTLSVAMEFLMYKKFLDPLFPKKTSANVVAVRKPKGEVKRRIIFSGHCDAANEWYFTHLGGSKLLQAVIILGFGSLFFALLSAAAASIAGYVFSAPEGAFKVLGYIQYGCIPFGVIVLFFTNWKLVVDGANDNLTGTVASMAVIKFLSDNDIRFENTEVRAVLTGSEEAGLRGAKAYAAAHLEECKEVETAFVGLETLRDFEHLAVYTRDMTGTVKNDPQVCALLKAAAKNVGLDLPYKSVYFGASDAAAVSQGYKIPAATLASMDPAPARYYHTRTDTADNLDSKTILAGLNIALESAFLFDSEGLKENY